ncbi:response regulator transcription factor [Sphaerochaeta globosa]|uniref:Two component transcriptional regulator, LuxR family n=1 Tax=Sphaerochaeta globosa (strain ATCC BAA-1886 / DSM 22777 / Buddy) TaxID=158189 RepID=F0RT41_SPHGB|nr:response regulator transcription factor [Sphaerochaeta globosa]ADY14487.1 two component transcriptional regulator, LuxR family [Sphaerochaeta globosa str. Buddy]
MRLLLVDDDVLVLESLEILLSDDPMLTIAGKAENGAQALSFLQKQSVDLVLLDIQMPVMDGIEAAQRIRAEFPPIKILMLTTFADYRTLHRCLESGASGFLLKSDSTEKQILTIKAVHQGLPVISEQALKSFSDDQLFSDLTQREQDVLMQLAQGLSNKEIATRLCMSEGTVRNMISVMLDKLDLRDRTQLAIAYWQRKSRGR